MIDIGLDCCGCGVCSLKCPVNAIKMESDVRGFSFPRIDSGKCISCGICDKSCPVANNKKSDGGSAFLAKSLDTNVRSSSSSGGLFFSLAHYFVKQKGIVYGAAYNCDYSVEIIRAESIDDIRRIQGSKYVASHACNSFLKVRDDLNQGKLVLYSGLPCQIAALRHYLSQDYSNLFCMEIVCAGVCSPRLLRSYVEEAAEGDNKVETVNFRSKRSGWKDYSVELLYQNGKHKYVLHQTDNYLRLYNTTLPNRESCFNCHFKRETSESDLTVGDAWGVPPLKDDDLGASIVIVHTKKGKDLLSYIKNDISQEPWIGPIQKAITQSYVIPANYQVFKNEFSDEVSCGKLADKYAPISQEKNQIDHETSTNQAIVKKVTSIFAR